MIELQKKYKLYKKKNLDNPGIGRLYERQIRYIYETKGWRVEPYGILKGKSDLGRDLICTKKKQVLITQAKNWSVKNKKIGIDCPARKTLQIFTSFFIIWYTKPWV